MASELSRWQLLDTVEQTDPQVQSDSFQRSCARATIKHHDADLRQQQTIDQLCIKAQANELGRLRQQLEHSQQLVTDGQEAIGHWQGEYEQLRQQLETIQKEWDEDVEDLCKHCACEWEGEEPRKQITECLTHMKLRQRLEELEQERDKYLRWYRELEKEIFKPDSPEVEHGK